MTITWLHISDFHFRAGDPYDRDEVLGALVRSVKSYREAGRRPDLVFATGDIAYSGKAAEYQIATTFFDELLAAVGLDKRRLFVVPGNHDVDRDLGIGLARTLDTREQCDQYFSPALPKPHLTSKQREFIEWFDRYFDGIRSFPRDTSCGPIEAIALGGVKFGILPIDTALFCQGDDDYDKLLIGRRCLDPALQKLKELNADLTLALVHHPLDWLNAIERSNIRAALHAEIDVVLRGHLHETDVETVAGISGTTLYLAAGAAYQTRKWHNRAIYASLDGERLTVYPIGYVDSPRPVWTTDPSLFPVEPGHERTFTIQRMAARPPAPTVTPIPPQSQRAGPPPARTKAAARRLIARSTTEPTPEVPQPSGAQRADAPPARSNPPVARVEQLLEQLIGNDPVRADAAVAELASFPMDVLQRLTVFVAERSDRIIYSFPAMVQLAKLFGRFNEAGVEALVESIRSGHWNTKLIAAHGFRYVSEPQAKAKAESAMVRLLDEQDRDLVRPAIIALGELGAVMAAGRVMESARRDDDRAYDLYAMDCLLRLIAADDTDSFLGMRFADFNDLFRRNSHQGLSYVHFTLPEWKGRVRDHAVDLVIHSWVNSDDPQLIRLGADILGILRIGRTRGSLIRRIEALVAEERDDDLPERLAIAWGCIGATDEASLDALEEFYSSANERLVHCAFFALAWSLPDLMARPPARRRQQFFDRFLDDALDRPEGEHTANILLGLGRRRQRPGKIRQALSSPEPLVRAGAALALAWSEGGEVAEELRRFADDANPTSFERLIALSAMARFDPAAADRLHQALCAVPPNDLWHLRHGVEPPGPRVLNPYPWMREIIYALSLAPDNGRQRAERWAEVLLLDAPSMISEREAARPPKVFISYSWDNPNHRRWVASFAARLERDAIDTALDQTDVALGERFGHFMERAVDENDFVLCVCTPEYKARFDGRRGGVGAEADLMAPLFQRNERKFIPILRTGDWESATPRYLRGKRGLDFRGHANARTYQELLDHFFRTFTGR